MTRPQRYKGRSKVRTWSLATLSRHMEYLLFWHEGTRSWEVVEIDRSSTVVTRESIRQRRQGTTGDATEGAQRRGLSTVGPVAAQAEDA